MIRITICRNRVVAVEVPKADQPNTSTNPAARPHKTFRAMSDQNKNTGTSSTPNTGAGQPAKNTNEPGATKTPNLEQGREHTPNVEGKKDAADTRRTAEQAHTPTATTDTNAKPNTGANERKENEAGDAKRTTAEGEGSKKPGHDPVRPTGDTNTGGNR
jgi:hypothetical protein